jgi:hypothetical protein
MKFPWMEKTVKFNKMLLLGLALAMSFPMLVAAQEKTADEISRELANPNNDLAKLTFKNQYRWYTGDLEQADKQGNYTLLFQPVFPFSLGTTESGDKEVFFLRPAIPFVMKQPLYDPQQDDYWGSKSGMGDISFDAAYAITKKNGWIMAGGVITTLPYASSQELTAGQYRMGPEALIGKISEWGLLGVFPYHQWNIAGSRGPQEKRHKDYSLTNMQLFAVHTMKGGWTVGSTPILAYDWKSKDWTVPIQLNVTRTMILNKRPWKFELEAIWYADQADAFGPDFMLGFNVTPVVNNFIENMFKGKK